MSHARQGARPRGRLAGSRTKLVRLHPQRMAKAAQKAALAVHRADAHTWTMDSGLNTPVETSGIGNARRGSISRSAPRAHTHTCVLSLSGRDGHAPENT